MLEAGAGRRGRARGIIIRDMVTGEIETYVADVVVLRTGGYSNVFYLSTNAMRCNVTAIWRAHQAGRGLRQSVFHPDPPDLHPVSGDYQSKLTLMSESLRNDGRVWVPNTAGDKRAPRQIPEAERDYYLERNYPSFGNLAPRDIASRAAKEVCDEGRGVGRADLACFSTSLTPLDGSAARPSASQLRQPLRDVRAHHRRRPVQRTDAHLSRAALHHGRAVGRLQPAEHDPGLFVGGEANFSDHGANRLGASALMQGLADGYFVLPATIPDYLAERRPGRSTSRIPPSRKPSKLLPNASTSCCH